MGTTAQKLQAIVDSKAAIKTAISNKGGTITDSTPLDEYATAINGIQSADSIIDGSAVSVKTGVTNIIDYMFYSNNVLEEIEFTNLTAITSGNSILSGCSKLSRISCPKLATIMTQVFYNCAGITEINDTMFPVLSTISGSVFCSLSNLTTVTLSNIATFSSANAFVSCPYLELLDLSSCTFTGTGNIMRTSGTSTTYGCVVKLPSTCNSVGSLAFQNAKLKEVWLYNPNQIVSMVAGGLSQARTTSNPIAVYVPSSMLATYQADSSFTILVNNNKVTLNSIPE